MTDRLTERVGDGIRYYNGEYTVTCYPKNNNLTPVDKLAAKLCEFEDMIENGTIIVPPCKVGDDAWWIDPETKEVQCTKNGIKGICYYGDGNFKVISTGENEPEALHTIWCMLSEKEANERLAVMIAEGSKQ